MHEYHKIKQKIVGVLSPLGFVEVVGDTDLDYCGSRHCIHANNDKRFMIQWDGEEGFGSVESWVNESWIMLKTIVPESAESEFNIHLNSLCEELKTYL